MQTYLRIDINLSAMLLLSIVYLFARKRLEREDEMNRLFLRTSLVILLGLFIESLSCVFNGKEDAVSHVLLSFTHVLLFSIAPFLTYHWYRFVRRWVDPRSVESKVKWVLLVPVVINGGLSLLSPFYGLVFSISQGHQYLRGPFFLAAAVITYFYILLAVTEIWRHRSRMVREECVPMLLFGILPLIGAALQCLFYGVLLMWSCCAFSMVIVYSFLQFRMVQKDKLTGVWNRSSFDYYLEQRLRQKDRTQMGVIFFDLDGLKTINDQFGHVEGDRAICRAVEIMKRNLRKNDVLARFGGDEFIALIDGTTIEELDATVHRLESCFEEYNKEQDGRYRLSCSYGWDLCGDQFESPQEIVNHVDMQMYCSKRGKERGAFNQLV